MFLIFIQVCLQRAKPIGIVSMINSSLFLGRCGKRLKKSTNHQARNHQSHYSLVVAGWCLRYCCCIVFVTFVRLWIGLFLLSFHVFLLKAHSPNNINVGCGITFVNICKFVSCSMTIAVGVQLSCLITFYIFVGYNQCHYWSWATQYG